VSDNLAPASSKRGRLQRACLEILRAHEQQPNGLPTSTRFIYYELVQRGDIAKKPAVGKRGGRRPDQDVAEVVFLLRKNGLIPWEWIVDETRNLDSWRYADTVADFLKDTVAGARIDLWEGEPPPMILTESRSLAGVLRDLAYQYLCPIAATNGQVGGFLRTDIAPALEHGQRGLPRRLRLAGRADRGEHPQGPRRPDRRRARLGARRHRRAAGSGPRPAANSQA
jgi:hypothetical protein